MSQHFMHHRNIPRVTEIPFSESERGIKHAELEKRLLASTYVPLTRELNNNRVVSYETPITQAGYLLALSVLTAAIAHRFYK